MNKSDAYLNQRKSYKTSANTPGYFYEETEAVIMKVLTPVKANRAYCVECSGIKTKEVKLSPVENCPLYPYRMDTTVNAARGLQVHKAVKKRRFEKCFFVTFSAAPGHP